MTFFVEDSGLILTHALYKIAALVAVLRWVLSWVLRYRAGSRRSGPSSLVISPETIKDSLGLALFGDVLERTPWLSETCAVCLGLMEEADEVRELRNCRHVFHRECIDRWVDYDDHDHDTDLHDHDHDHDEGNHRTCPLCRTPLVVVPPHPQAPVWPRREPSWAVEKLIYLFGDDPLAP